MTPDPVDTVAQQAIMIAMACGPEGMEVAAAISVAEAIYDTLYNIINKANPTRKLSSWSEMQAMEDLSSAFRKDLLITSEQDQNSVVGGIIGETKIIAADLQNWATSNITVSDINNWEGAVASGNIQTVFGWWNTHTMLGKKEQVQYLAGFLSARVAYHAYCVATLKLRCRFLNRNEDIAWLYLGNQVRNALEISLQETIDYADPPIKKLVDSVNPEISWQTIQKSHSGPRADSYEAFTKDIRSRQAAAFTDQVRYASGIPYFTAGALNDISSFAEIIENTKALLHALQSAPLATKSPAGKSTKGKLGIRAPNTLRVQFEYPKPPKVKGGEPIPDPVFGNGPVPHQTVAVEVVGRSNGNALYQLPASGLAANSASDALSKSGVLSQVNTELIQAYDTRFGSGQYAVDSQAAVPPHTSSSLSVPLASGAGSIGTETLALFFVSMSADFFDLPDYSDKQAVSTVARQTYDDLFKQMANWNASKSTPLTAIRISLVSEQDLVGDMLSSYVSAALAEVVVDAAIGAMNQSPQHLGDLTLLVPVDAAPGGWLRKSAFSQVAKGRSANVLADGFDLPTS